MGDPRPTAAELDWFLPDCRDVAGSLPVRSSVVNGLRRLPVRLER